MAMIKETVSTHQELLSKLDRGIDDIRAGRTLPHDAAMKQVLRIRCERREERDRVRDIDQNYC